MDTLENMRTLLVVARLGSFTAAAQEFDLVPSVVTKRVSQLERVVGAKLLLRSTRKVTLSPEGEAHLGRIEAAVRAYDEALATIRRGIQHLEGPIRIKVPTTLGLVRLNGLIRGFARRHPGLDIEVLLLDGPLNPSTEGVDIALTAFPASFDGVSDEFLWPLRRALLASPDYLARSEPLDHPRQLERHRCIVYQPLGPTWSFLSKAGVIAVTVRPRLSSNDMLMLIDAVRDGEGVGVFSKYIAAEDLNAGILQATLQEFPVPEVWVKAMVPIDRLALPRVRSLLEFLRTAGKSFAAV